MLVAILSDAQVGISARLADMGAVLSFDIKSSSGRHRISVVPPK